MASAAARAALYHFVDGDYYYCLGCGASLETPYRAVLKSGRPPMEVKSNPENRLLWLELMSLDHADCGKFKDEQKAQDHRTYRRHVIRTASPKGDDGPAILRSQGAPGT
jgi:hypothetical protein